MQVCSVIKWQYSTPQTILHHVFKGENRALLIKLFYENGGNLLSALHKYRRLNFLRKGPTSRQAMKKMIQKFEKTGDLRVMQERERISNETVEEVPFIVVESEPGSQCFASGARAVSHDLSFPWSTVRKILKSILKCYPHKISFLEQLTQDFFF